MDASKWTPERREAFKGVVEAARRFVRTADEFADDHPEACGEDYEALVNAIDAEGRTWDGDDFTVQSEPGAAIEVLTRPLSERERSSLDVGDFFTRGRVTRTG